MILQFTVIARMNSMYRELINVSSVKNRVRSNARARKCIFIIIFKFYYLFYFTMKGLYETLRFITGIGGNCISYGGLNRLFSQVASSVRNYLITY